MNEYNYLGGKDNYYIKADDLGMICLIQNWNENGISALYDEDVANNIETKYQNICNSAE